MSIPLRATLEDLAMTFSLSDERKMIRETAREFAFHDVLPITNEYDPDRPDIPESLRPQLAETGFFQNHHSTEIWWAERTFSVLLRIAFIGRSAEWNI